MKKKLGNAIMCLIKVIFSKVYHCIIFRNNKKVITCDKYQKCDFINY